MFFCFVAVQSMTVKMAFMFKSWSISQSHPSLFSLEFIGIWNKQDEQECLLTSHRLTTMAENGTSGDPWRSTLLTIFEAVCVKCWDFCRKIRSLFPFCFNACVTAGTVELKLFRGWIFHGDLWVPSFTKHGFHCRAPLLCALCTQVYLQTIQRLLNYVNVNYKVIISPNVVTVAIIVWQMFVSCLC